MAIGTLHIEHLAEHSVLRHIEAVELEEVITAVLKHHTVQADLLAEVDERPYLAQVHGRRHLDGHVLAMLHGILGHNKVVEPVGGDIHQVDVLALAQFLVSVLTVIYIGRGHGCGAQNGVAEGHHLGAVDMGKAAHGVGTAHAQSYKSHTHHLELGCSESQCGLLAGRTFGNLGDDSAIHCLVGPVKGHLSAGGERCHKQSHQYQQSDDFLVHYVFNLDCYAKLRL